MSVDTFDLTPQAVWLDFSETVQQNAWEAGQSLASPSLRQLTYLNRLVQAVIVPWIQEYVPEAALEEGLSDRCPDGINGTAIAIEDQSLIILPSEVIDCDELRIPAAWIEGDRLPMALIAAQVDTQERLIRLWGYTTPAKVKQFGNRSPQDGCYVLDADRITEPIGTLWVQWQLYPEALRQIHSERVEQPQIVSVALSNLQLIPGVEGSGTESWTEEMTRLGQWFHQQFEAHWVGIQTLIAPRLISSFMDNQIKRAKLIDLGMDVAGQPVALMITLGKQTERVGIQAALYPTGEQETLPPHLTLKILTEAGEVFKEIRARQDDEFIRYQFDAEPGDRFNLEISLENARVVESFQV